MSLHVRLENHPVSKESKVIKNYYISIGRGKINRKREPRKSVEVGFFQSKSFYGRDVAEQT